MIQKLWQIILKEWRVAVRTPAVVFLLILSPIVMMGLVPFGLSGSIKLRLSVVDQSYSNRGRETVAELSRSPFFDSVDLSMSLEEAARRMDYGELDGIVVIPPDGEGYSLLVDGTHSYLAADAEYYVIQQLAPPETGSEKIKATTKFLTAPDNKHYYIVAMLTLMLAVVGSGLAMYSVLVDRKRKSIEHLRSTGVPAGLYVISKVLFFSFAGILETMLGLAIAYLVFGFHFYGSPLAFALLAVCFLFSMTSLGVTVASYSENIVQATYILVFLFCILALTGTIFVPLDMTEKAMAAMRYANPFYWMTDGGWKILLKGAGAADTLLHCIVLAGTGALLCFANVPKIKQTD